MIATKNEFRAKWLAGELGNRPRVWTSIEDLKASGYRGDLSLRVHAASSQHSRYNVKYESIEQITRELQADGASGIWYNESAPDDQLVLQGEFFHGTGRSGTFLDRYLMFSWQKTKMKDAFACGQPRSWSEGVMTKLLLASVMTPTAWEQFHGLCNQYEDHTIEFSVYGHDVGIEPHNNVLIWEVRAY